MESNQLGSEVILFLNNLQSVIGVSNFVSSASANNNNSDSE